MSTKKAGVVLAALCGVCAVAPVGVVAQEWPSVWIEGSPGEWALGDNASIGWVDGRQALLLGSGPRVFRTDLEFANGTIEFDVAPSSETVFVGVVFRGTDPENYETVYLRPGASGGWDAVQYMPVIKGGATWQLYPEFNAKAEVPRDRWTHVRLDVEGQEAVIRVGEVEQATMVVHRLRGETRSGRIGFWATGPSGREEAVAISNVVVTPSGVMSDPGRAASVVEAPPGSLTGWEISAPVVVDRDGPIRWLPEADGWRWVAAEEGGLVNLTRHLGAPGDGQRWTALARTTLRASGARIAPLDVAYSDEVTVFLNGSPIYSGRGGWSTRYPGFLGSLTVGFDQAYLQLEEGDNELVLAITEESTFGWGFKARLPEDVEGVWATGGDRN